jgi:membrane protein DedA with SNARE-associated domain
VSSLLLAIQVRHHLHGPSIDYAGLGLAATVGWVGIPGIGEAALIAAGVVAARGKLDIAEVVAVAFLGATAGGVLGWAIGMRVGHSVFGGPGPFRQARLRMLQSGQRFYDRYGVLAVFFTPSWLAGINRMRSRAYLILNAVSALLWALTVGLGAYFIGPSIEDIVSDVGLAGIVIVVGIIGAGAVAQRVRRRRLRRPSRAPD